MVEKFKESIDNSIQKELASLEKEIKQGNKPGEGDNPTLTEAIINAGKLTAQKFNEAQRTTQNKTNKEKVNSTPEMSINEIMKLSKDDIVFDVDRLQSDKLGKFTVIKGKKVYVSFGDRKRIDKLINEGKPVASVEWSPTTEGYAYFTIGKKVGNIIKGVSCGADDGLQSYYRGTYRGELEPGLEISSKNWNDDSKREWE